MTQRIAVIGAGVAGLTAAWLLSARHRVTLFEAEGRCGGHANTVDVTLDGVTAPVDTGFLVFNERTYPNLIAIFEALGVRSVASDMSFSVRVERANLEWAGTSIGTVFAQRSNVVNPRFLRMLSDMLRFNREATALAQRGAGGAQSLGEFLRAGRYCAEFTDWYLVPMAAAIWSTPEDRILDYPLATFARFSHNHGLLQVRDRPRWMTVQGGSREYVRRMLPAIGDVRTATPVAAVTRDASGVDVTDAHGRRERFDQIVLASHSGQSLAMLRDASESERWLLGSVRYQPNRAVLHTDASLLPRRRPVWSAWNYASETGADGRNGVCVSYLINKLQPLPFRTPVIVTLNPVRAPDPSKVIAEFDYEHPLFDQAAIDAQARIQALQGANRTWYAGAWLGYGFHEDGVNSALAVSRGLGADAPWSEDVRGSSELPNPQEA